MSEKKEMTGAQISEKEAKTKGAAYLITAEKDDNTYYAYLREPTFDDVAVATGASQTNVLRGNKLFFERTAIKEITDPLFFTDTKLLLQACKQVDGIVSFEGGELKKL